MKVLNKKEILKRKKEIEQEILDLLKETKSDFNLDYIKEVIYNEEDNDDLMKAFAVFDRGGDIDEMNEILEVVNDAWNYFPHKCLNGLSPTEKILEYQKKNKN